MQILIINAVTCVIDVLSASRRIIHTVHANRTGQANTHQLKPKVREILMGPFPCEVSHSRPPPPRV